MRSMEVPTFTHMCFDFRPLGLLDRCCALFTNEWKRMNRDKHIRRPTLSCRTVIRCLREGFVGTSRCPASNEYFTGYQQPWNHVERSRGIGLSGLRFFLMFYSYPKGTYVVVCPTCFPAIKYSMHFSFSVKNRRTSRPIISKFTR